MLIRYTAPGWKSRLVTTVCGSPSGGLIVGFESMIRTVLAGSSSDLKANTSVRSSRVSSPGYLRLSALKWFDIVTPMLLMCAGGMSAAEEVQGTITAPGLHDSTRPPAPLGQG